MYGGQDVVIDLLVKKPFYLLPVPDVQPQDPHKLGINCFQGHVIGLQKGQLILCCFANDIVMMQSYSRRI